MENEVILNSADWINAGGLLLILIGISFFIVEFFLPSFGLFGFAGIAATIIGIIQLHQTGYIDDLPISINALIGLSMIGIALSALGGWYSYKLYKRKVTTGVEAMVGEHALVQVWQKKAGKVRIQGEDWQAYADEPLDLKKDDTVMIAKIDGLKIKIIKPD